jgi:ceramide glucosyltransferase
MSPRAFFEYAGMAFLLLAVFGASYGLIAIGATRHFLRRARPAAKNHPSISVLKPLHGAEPELYENLVSFCAHAYAGPVQIVLGVQDPTDPALAVALRVKDDHPDRDIVIVGGGVCRGANRKIGNLINMAAHAVGEVIVISDSDVRIPAGALDQIVATLEEPDVGLIYCLYRGRPTMGGWSQLAAMDVNFRFAASAVVGEALGAPICLGPTMALRHDLLTAVGGFEHFADVLADDFELGQAVRATGQRVTCPPLVIDHLFPETSAREMLVHELRWARTIRLVEPAGYIGSVLIHYLALALIGSALMSFSVGSLVFLTVICALRLAQAAVMTRMLSVDRRLLWLIPLRDLISFGVFIAGLFGEGVEWRGHRLRVSSKGAIAAW